ncbi:MAG: methyltransferase domain-containing protein [Actinomycetota bacterium]|nr:methyltransferase domain-containing protein [Actinomycetota bacterium]
MTPVEWKAEEYDHQAAPHEDWSDQILSRLELKGDETVLDAGCGTGRLTKRLVERVPDGRVIGVDASSAMLEKAREHLGDDADLRQADLTQLNFDEDVDAVYSSAVFHWIQGHEALFRSLHGVMRPGAALEAQFGGQGNIVEIERALDALAGDERFAPYLRGDTQGTNFASVGDTESRLAAAGFSDVRVWTQPWPVKPKDPHGYVSTVILPWHLDRLPAELHQPFVRAVIETAPRPLTVNYVRLNISARA